jgi:anti-sigma factor RsiW
MSFDLSGGHVTRWLSAYCEGVLPPAEAGRVAAHVLACQRCHRELTLVRTGARLAARLRPAPTDDPPSALPAWGDLVPLLDGPPARTLAWLPNLSFSFSAIFRWAPAMAMAVLLTSAALVHRGPLPHAAIAPAPLEEVALAAHRGGAPELTGDERLVRRWIAGEPVTLIEGASGAAPVRTKQVTYRMVDDLQVASWTLQDRRYVLVSRLSGDAACTVCHTVL